jgi:hypothetical protein
MGLVIDRCNRNRPMFLCSVPRVIILLVYLSFISINIGNDVGLGLRYHRGCRPSIPWPTFPWPVWSIMPWRATMQWSNQNYRMFISPRIFRPLWKHIGLSGQLDMTKSLIYRPTYIHDCIIGSLCSFNSLESF